jgi:hypothetical protein
MKSFNIKPTSQCRYDILSLGKIMLRLDPGEGRIHSSRQFNVWEGGGEYNVARGLRRCFGQRAAVVTAFAKNELGLLMEDLILQGGVETSLIKWVDYDGIGREVRNGLYFLERGYGIRGAVGCSDRGNTAISQLTAGEIDWDYIFGDLGVRCNAICPGTVHPPSLDDRLNATGDYDAALEAFKSRQPMGRLADSGEISPLVLYLLSEESRFITGQTIAIDGGWSA